MSYQAVKRRAGTLNIYCWVKEANLKRPHTLWFQPCGICKGQTMEAVKWPVPARAQGVIRVARLLCTTLQSRDSPPVQHEASEQFKPQWGFLCQLRVQSASRQPRGSSVTGTTTLKFTLILIFKELLTQRVRCALYGILWHTYGFTSETPGFISQCSLKDLVNPCRVWCAVVFTVNVTVRQTAILFLLLSLFL